MTTVEEELEYLKNNYSENELDQLGQDLTVSPVKEERVEEELTDLASKEKLRQSYRDQIKKARIVDYSIKEDHFEFKLKTPIGEETVQFEKNLEENSELRVFLQSINCTINDLSEAISQELPIVYRKEKLSGWTFNIYYGDTEEVQEVLNNRNKYRCSGSIVRDHLLYDPKLTLFLWLVAVILILTVLNILWAFLSIVIYVLLLAAQTILAPCSLKCKKSKSIES